tara:strand:+ start:139 stop:240 length:102 start_codon:yes stop_codon:yes gene_type:complete
MVIRMSKHKQKRKRNGMETIKKPKEIKKNDKKD